MSPRSTIALCFLLPVAISRGAIDLTPFAAAYQANGMTFQQLVFKDDKRRIEYEYPRTWSFQSGQNELRLKPPKNFAEAVISATPAEKPQPMDATAAKKLEEQVMATIPSGSQFVKIEQEVENTVLLDGNNTFEITVSYQLMGEKFSRSVLFANLPGTQLVFRLTARKDDFAALHREFQTSIFTWHYAVEAVETKSDKAADPPAAAN